MPSRVLAGIPLVLLACSPPPAPQPAPRAVAEPAPAEAPAPAPAATPTKKVYTPEELDRIGPRPAPEPPLTQEELDLLAADTATLSKEMRIKQAYARRRKTLQNPDSPLARQLEALRLAHLRGEITPQLPNRSASPAESSRPDAPTPTPAAPKQP